MLRLAASRVTRPALFSTSRTFSVSALKMAEGDTGATPATGQPDAFQKRERASEDYAIRQREKEKLLELKRKLAEQQVHLDQLSKHIDDITKEQAGGEHN